MYNFFQRSANIMAYLGGLMLTALVVLTCASILGRTVNGMMHSDAMMSVAPDLAKWVLSLGVGPINGDFELVEAGVAFAIFAFLPICQLAGAHAVVDIFTTGLSEKNNRRLQAVIDILFALIILLIAVQLFAGMQSKINSGQVSLLLQFPVWWSYAFSMVGAAVTTVITIYIATIRVVEAVKNQDILPQPQGADH